MKLPRVSASDCLSKSIESIAEEVLRGIEHAGTLRALHSWQGPVGPRMTRDGREIVLFSSGNYLDLAHHPEVVEAAARAACDFGAASGGSRLINGNLTLHDALEDELAAFFGRESALVFSTGYMLNVGVVPALVGPGDVILSDALVHASLVDGVRLSRADCVVFPHADVDTLRQHLEAVRPRARRILIVVDGVYSMDGDVAPLAQIVELARRYEAITFVDDAHGTGTLGAHGRGAAELAGVLSEVDILSGTLGKALGSFGAFLVGSRRLVELLINTARTFIFSCALAPPQVAAARAALRLVQAEPWRRHQLQAHAQVLRTQLQAAGIATGHSTSQIVPVVLGDNQLVMAAQQALLALGYHAQAIRHPSVPRGAARLRVTPMATHREAEVLAFTAALRDVLAELGTGFTAMSKEQT